MGLERFFGTGKFREGSPDVTGDASDGSGNIGSCVDVGRNSEACRLSNFLF
jgi:hypothetical protein